MGISAIVHLKNQRSEELAEMLSWNEPAFGTASGQKELYELNGVQMGAVADAKIYKDGELVLLFWGELFKDTPENVLTRYHQHKEACLEDIDGEFAFILLDAASNQLFAVRDRLGIYPLYWCINNKSGYFSTSLKAILATGTVSPTPDLSGLAAALSLGFISQDVTCIENVNRLLPGYYLKLSLTTGQFSISPYWSFSSTFSSQYSSRFESSTDIYCELERQIKNAIERRGPKKIGCQSGTIGSYMIWDSHSKQGQLIDVAPTADDFLKNLIPMVWSLEMPNATNCWLESWKFVEACKQQNLACYFDTGFEAEFYDYSKEALELFQSHYLVKRNFEPSFWSKIAFRLFPRVQLDAMRRMQEATPQIAFLENNLLFSQKEFREAAGELSSYFDLDLFIHQFYNLNRIAKLDASFFYLTIKSRISDGISESRLRIAQSHGIKSQSPFLDYHLLQFFSSIAPEIWASPDLISAFPKYWKQNRDVPEEVSLWKNGPQTNFDILLSKELRPWLLGLTRGTLVETGLISSSWLKKALKTPEKYIQGLYAILILEIWMRLFIDLPLQKANKDLKLEDILKRA